MTYCLPVVPKLPCVQMFHSFSFRCHDLFRIMPPTVRTSEKFLQKTHMTVSPLIFSAKRPYCITAPSRRSINGPHWFTEDGVRLTVNSGRCLQALLSNVSPFLQERLDGTQLWHIHDGVRAHIVNHTVRHVSVKLRLKHPIWDQSSYGLHNLLI